MHLLAQRGDGVASIQWHFGICPEDQALADCRSCPFEVSIKYAWYYSTYQPIERGKNYAHPFPFYLSINLIGASNMFDQRQYDLVSTSYIYLIYGSGYHVCDQVLAK